jgi:hypothetical protein
MEKTVNLGHDPMAIDAVNKENIVLFSATDDKELS